MKRKGGEGAKNMGLSYENQRVHFDALKRKYLEYLSLYAAINHGSLEGASTFEQFYWHMTYISRYQDKRNFSSGL